MQTAFVLAGLGAAAALMVIPTAGAVAENVPSCYRSRVNGLISSCTAYGQVANGVLASWLLPGDAWRKPWIVAGSASLAITLCGFIALRVFASQVFVHETARTAENSHASGGWRRLATARNLTVWTLLALAGMVCGPWQNFVSSFLVAERGYPLETIARLWSIIGAVGLLSGFVAGLAAARPACALPSRCLMRRWPVPNYWSLSMQKSGNCKRPRSVSPYRSTPSMA
ncbi:MFS transporter [Caballeronia sp. LZ043]|nr:MFS transporter [Caballeronia sp. LZ043]MDR5825572.1 MFS transporter [Caballeronia sp. LZ043]